MFSCGAALVVQPSTTIVVVLNAHQFFFGVLCAAVEQLLTKVFSCEDTVTYYVRGPIFGPALLCWVPVGNSYRPS